MSIEREGRLARNRGSRGLSEAAAAAQPTGISGTGVIGTLGGSLQTQKVFF